MALYPYLTRTGPRGLLGYRRSVPEPLRPLVGKREYLCAFGTANLEQALPRYHAFAAHVDGELARARATLSAHSLGLAQPTQDGPTPSALSLLADLLHQRAAKQRQQRYQTTLSQEQALRTDAAQRAPGRPGGDLARRCRQASAIA